MAKKKSTTRSLKWKFPSKQFFFMKIETLFVAILAVLIFVWSFSQYSKPWLYATIATLTFLVIYVVISYLVQQWRKDAHHYKITGTHLEITKKNKKKTKKETIHLKEIKHHKLDKIFLGGYVVTKAGKRHSLFFNTKEELLKFENLIKKSLKKPSRRKQK